MIYDNVKAHCQRLGITIMECEKRAGLGNGVIGAWRQSYPRVDSLMAVAEVLGVDVSELLKGSDVEKKE